MARRTPKAIGTAAESLACKWMRDHGWPTAIRLEELGIKNQGDILVSDEDRRVTAEVKAGWSAAQGSAPERLPDYLARGRALGLDVDAIVAQVRP